MRNRVARRTFTRMVSRALIEPAQVIRIDRLWLCTAAGLAFPVARPRVRLRPGWAPVGRLGKRGRRGHDRGVEAIKERATVLDLVVDAIKESGGVGSFRHRHCDWRRAPSTQHRYMLASPFVNQHVRLKVSQRRRAAKSNASSSSASLAVRGGTGSGLVAEVEAVACLRRL